MNVQTRQMSVVALTLLATPGFAQHSGRLNPVVELLEQGKPVFGLYAPSNPREPRGGQPASPAVRKTPAELAREAVRHTPTDFIFDGSMEGRYDEAYPVFAEFARATPFLRRHHPLIIKTPRIAPDPSRAAERISRQLNLGVSGIVFVGVESAAEVEAGLAMMRFKSQGGTRPEDVGDAPAYWGMSETEYRSRADLWPLNPNGELINWTIVESREGLAHVREIAAVKGIGVLFPGAGTLRGVFTTTNASGQRELDEQGWEGAIQQVLSACKEFHVPCGYPANAADIEMRMRQGFSVFVIGWGEPGFKAVNIGRAAAGRTDSR